MKSYFMVKNTLVAEVTSNQQGIFFQHYQQTLAHLQFTLIKGMYSRLTLKTSK